MPTSPLTTRPSEARRRQVTGDAAEVYEQFFVPAMFGEWPPRLADAAGVESAQRVLDVGCGTGVLARELATRLAPGGSVVGLDPNEGMLRVASRIEDGIEWRPGRAEALPFEDGAFDAVLSQFALMFFEDPADALREMARVTRPGGRIVVAVWDRLGNVPGYAAVVALLEELFGERTADALRMPFAMGDPAALRALFASAGLTDADLTTHVGRARFPSLSSWMYTQVRGWTLSEEIDDDAFERLLTAAWARLGRFVTRDGSVRLDMPAHVVVAIK